VVLSSGQGLGSLKNLAGSLRFFSPPG